MKKALKKYINSHPIPNKKNPINSRKNHPIPSGSCMDLSLFFVASSVCRCMRWISFCASSRSSLAASWRSRAPVACPEKGAETTGKTWEKHRNMGKTWNFTWFYDVNWIRHGDLMWCICGIFINFHEVDEVWATEMGLEQREHGEFRNEQCECAHLVDRDWEIHKEEWWVRNFSNAMENECWHTLDRESFESTVNGTLMYLWLWTWTFRGEKKHWPTPSTPRDEWLIGSVSRPPSVEAPRYLGTTLEPFLSSNVPKLTLSFGNEVVDSIWATNQSLYRLPYPSVLFMRMMLIMVYR